MKARSYRSFLMPIASILVCLIVFGMGINKELKEVVASELANFDIQGLCAVAGMLILGACIYVFANRFRKGREKSSQQKGDNSYQRPLHQRTTTKKTA